MGSPLNTTGLHTQDLEIFLQPRVITFTDDLFGILQGQNFPVHFPICQKKSSNSHHPSLCHGFKTTFSCYRKEVQGTAAPATWLLLLLLTASLTLTQRMLFI